MPDNVIILSDRIKEISYATGTGALQLNGAATGFSAFGSFYANDALVYYAITDGTRYEVGSGVYRDVSGGDSYNNLIRYPFKSTSSDGLVNFPEGVKEVYVTYPAAYSVYTASGLDPAYSQPQSSGMAFWETANILNYDSSVIWDSTNSRLGISTDAPGYAIDVGGTALYSAIRASGFITDSSGVLFPDGQQLEHFLKNELDVTSGTDDVFALSGVVNQYLLFKQQNAGLVLAGPPSGCTPPCSPAYPSFRALTADDLPDLSDTYVTEVGTASQSGVAFWHSDNVIGHDPFFVWDSANNKLGINDDNPLTNLSVIGNGKFTSNLEVQTNLTVGLQAFIGHKYIEVSSSGGSAYTNDAGVDGGGLILKSTDADKSWLWRDACDAWTTDQKIDVSGIIFNGDCNNVISGVYAAGSGLVLDGMTFHTGGSGNFETVLFHGTTPADTSQKLYRTGDDLMWNGASLGGAGGAPSSPSYITASGESALANERILTAGSGLQVTDNSAGGTITLDVKVSNASGVQITAQDELAVDINSASTASIASADYLLFHDVTDGFVKKGLASDVITGSGAPDDVGYITISGHPALSNELILNGVATSGIRIDASGSYANVVIAPSGLVAVTPASDDYVLISDISDEDNIRKATVTSLIGAAGGGATKIDELTDAGTNTTSMWLGTNIKPANATYSVAVGFQALDVVISSDFNVAVGWNALHTESDGTGYNTAVGYQALKTSSSTGSNVAIGANAMASATTGFSNIALGISAMGNSALTGNNNLVIGNNTMQYATSANSNTVVGTNAVSANIIGNYNTVVGWGSLIHSVGNGNVAIGHQAGLKNRDGSNFTGSNKFFLANDDTGAGNPLASGDFSTGDFFIPNGSLYIEKVGKGLVFPDGTTQTTASASAFSAGDGIDIALSVISTDTYSLGGLSHYGAVAGEKELAVSSGWLATDESIRGAGLGQSVWAGHHLNDAGIIASAEASASNSYLTCMGWRAGDDFLSTTSAVAIGYGAGGGHTYTESVSIGNYAGSKNTANDHLNDKYSVSIGSHAGHGVLSAVDINDHSGNDRISIGHHAGRYAHYSGNSISWQRSGQECSVPEGGDTYWLSGRVQLRSVFNSQTPRNR